MSILKFFSALILTALITSVTCYSQGKRNYGPYRIFDDVASQDQLRRSVSFISNDYAKGRATGDDGNWMVRQYIKDKFKEYGLNPYTEDTYYYQAFKIDTLVGRNVVGILPSLIPTNEYIIISAHFDHLGELKGSIYNGADDNASGVAAMLSLAEMFSTMRKTKAGPFKHIIFAAFDAKEHSMAGSKHFVNHLDIPKNRIVCNINIDQIGSVLEPVHQKDTNYVIILGEKTLRQSDRGKLAHCNEFNNINLDIDFTFYGSRNFTDSYYKLSDQASFSARGIPALLVTSGFNKHTYKVTDDENIISYPVLRKRILLIFHFVMLL